MILSKSQALESLQEQGIEPVYINIFKHIYKQAKSFIRMHKDSKSFHLGRGVRQGDTSSPKLFTVCLEKVFQKLQWENRGIKIDGEFISHLRFTDEQQRGTTKNAIRTKSREPISRPQHKSQKDEDHDQKITQKLTPQ